MRLRIKFRSTRAKILPLDDLIEQARQVIDDGAAHVLRGPFAIVEALDDRACVSWRAYCQDLESFEALVQTLQADRAAAK